MNWFEGGRRIVRLLQLLVLLGCGVGLFFNEPRVWLDLETTGPGEPWRLASKGCALSDAKEFRPDVEPDIKALDAVDLCFRSHPSEDGEMLVPYKNEGKNRWLMGGVLSEPVRSYIAQRIATFTLLPVQREVIEAEANRLWWQRWRDYLKFTAVVAGIGWFGLAGLAAVVGWIVRGFAGIPKGMDHRPVREAVE